jgi:hypothetical protein
MGSDRNLRRFLHLERARPAGPTAEPPREAADGTEERIAGVERPRAPRPGTAGHHTGAQLDRFGPEPEPTLELVDAEGRRPFVRCRRCSADNNVFATACTGCGADLDTPEQHEFDERFWTARQAEAEREARAEAERQELRVRAEAEDARARRAMGEAIAREVGDAERRRLGGLGGLGDPGGGPERGEWSPLGLRLFKRLLPDARLHIPAMAGAAGLCAVLAAYGLHAHSAALLVLGVGALVLLLVHAPE